MEQVPRARSGGAWTDEDDQLFARSGGAWELIYPDPAAAGDLLPVEALAVTSGPTHNSVTIGWTNPAQPTITPTEVQIRLATLGEVWTEVAYPVTAQAWIALDPETEYVAQVRLIRRVNGVITHTSTTRSVQFTTVEAPLSPPAPDPGGSGGDTTFTGGGSTGGNPVGGGTPPGTNDGCWWEWKFEIISLSTLDWIDTGITGTVDGSGAFSLDYDLSTLDATRTYRLCYRTACDTDTDGVADDFGDWLCGDPFLGGLNWDLNCSGIGDGPSETLPAAADAIFHLIDVCTDENDEIQMYDLTSGAVLGKGAGFGGIVQSPVTGEWAAIGASSIIIAQPVVTGYLTAIETAFVEGGDHTVAISLDKFNTTNGNSWKLLSIGLREFIQVDETATGYTVSWLVALESGLMTLTSAELDATAHDIVVRWDDDGTKSLWIDGVSVATDMSGETFGFPGFTGDLSIAAGPLDFVSRIIGWDRALADSEIEGLAGEFFGEYSFLFEYWAEDPDWTPPADGAVISAPRNNGTIGGTATTLANPTYDADGVGGKPAFAFPGEARFTQGGTVGTDFTVVVVAQLNTLTDGYFLGGSDGNNILVSTNGSTFRGYNNGGALNAIGGAADLLPVALVNRIATNDCRLYDGATLIASDLSGTAAAPGGIVVANNFVASSTAELEGRVAYVAVFAGDLTAQAGYASWLAKLMNHYGAVSG